MTCTALAGIICLPDHTHAGRNRSRFESQSQEAPQLPHRATTQATTRAKEDAGPRDARDIDALRTAPALDFETAILLYESLATKEAKIASEFLLQLTSDEYRNARDEFTRRARRQSAASALPGKIAKVASQRDYIVTIGYKLPQYDFERQGFSTGLQSTTYVSYPNRLPYSSSRHLDASGVAVRFANAPAFAFSEIPIDAAERYSASFAKSRDAVLIVAVEVKDTASDIKNYSQTYKALSCKIKRGALVYTPKDAFGKATDEVILSQTILEEPSKETSL
jgi:hypothetical protein